MAEQNICIDTNYILAGNFSKIRIAKEFKYIVKQLRKSFLTAVATLVFTTVRFRSFHLSL